MKITKFKLPKQWKHWLKMTGMKPHCNAGSRSSYGRKRSGQTYFIGQGFVWRVNCFKMLERGDMVEHFDRWALCCHDEAELPQSFAEFKSTIKQLKEKYDSSCIG
jgi:hypothetical protein